MLLEPEPNPIPEALMKEVQTIIRESLVEITRVKWEGKEPDPEWVRSPTMARIAGAACGYGFTFKELRTVMESAVEISFNETRLVILITL